MTDIMVIKIPSIALVEFADAAIVHANARQDKLNNSNVTKMRVGLECST